MRPTEKLDPKCFYLLHRHFGVLFQGFEDHELYDGCLIEVRLPSKYHKKRKQLSEVPEDAAALPPGVPTRLPETKLLLRTVLLRTAASRPRLSKSSRR